VFRQRFGFETVLNISESTEPNTLLHLLVKIKTDTKKNNFPFLHFYTIQKMDKNSTELLKFLIELESEDFQGPKILQHKFKLTLGVQE
jgi:hypothetical protein